VWITTISQLTLTRAIGLPLGQQFDLADQLPYTDINVPTVDEALAVAYKSRSDYRSTLDSVKAAQQNLSATKGERYPVVVASGDYGDVGTTFAHSHGVFAFQAGVTVPIFTGGRIKGDITQAEAEFRQRKAEAENICGQIDYDVRTAFLNLNAAKEQVTVAKQNVELANENLARSKDRFSSGVTDSVEVVQAEQSLASANDQYITSLSDHNLAKLGALVLVIAAGYFLWNAFRFVNTDDAEVDGHVMPLSARISGQIKDVFVIEGQVVHAGDVLVTT
jgi:outer membrane protein TolC